MLRYLGVTLFLLAPLLGGGCASSSSTSDSSGAMGASAFVGTWKAGGTNIVSCFSEATITQDITGSLAITAGPSSDTINVAYPDGCQLVFTVEGNVAMVAPRSMTCQGSIEMGTIPTSEESISHSLTLSADGHTLSESGNETVTETLPPTDASADANVILECNWVTNGLYTK
jgi:hypothetical protein